MTPLVSARELPLGSAYPSPRLEAVTQLASNLLQVQLQRLVERTAVLAAAPTVTLALRDPTSQALVLAASYAQRFTEEQPTNLRVQEAMARWVVTHRAPALIADLAHEPRAQTLGLPAIGSLLSMPLVAGEETLGALTIANPLIGAFGQQHLRLLKLVADLGALAIFQTQHLHGASQQAQHLTILLEVSRGLARTPDASAICSLTMWALERLILCEEAVLFRYQAGTETLCGVAGLGANSPSLAEAHLRIRDPQSVTAWSALQRRPMLYAGQANGLIGLTTENLLARREMALLAVPLVAGEQLLGVITLARSAPFATNDLQILLPLSQMIAPALAQTATGLPG